jgi:hypothetical protein
VLATYRGYAETLRDKGIASPQGDPRQANPLYYNLNLNGFIKFIQQGKTWNDAGIQNHKNKHGEKIFNGNLLSAQAPNVCLANSGATYLALVSYALLNNNQAPDEKNADEIANEAKPILRGQDLPLADLAKTYFSENGREQAPIVVIYEHQYLAYQISAARSGGPDLDRVLLYPSSNFLTVPGFIGLNQQGEHLGRLIAEDPKLQQRASELGFQETRPIPPSETGPLPQFLRQQGIPAPSTEGNDTRAVLPDLPVLERMIRIVGDCKDNEAAGQRVPPSREFAAFDSGLWWRAWWPWAIVWGFTVVAALATVSLLVTYLSKVIKRPAQRQIHGISFYLHDKSIMSFYQQQRYNAALERLVREKRRRSNNQIVKVTVGPGELGMNRKDDTDTFSEWIEREEPITVIGIIMDTLEDSDDIVHVDLIKQRIMQNRSLAKSVGWSDDQETTRRRSVRLHEIDAFILLKGRFQKTSPTETETIFLAPYGDSHDPDHVPRVRVKCVTSGLRNTVPDGRFQAQCLGKVEDWNPHSRELVIDAIAIFK